jgi:ribosomal protein L11 methylase PrmA
VSDPLAVVGVGVGTGVAAGAEADEDAGAVGAVDVEPHAASERAATPASNGTNVRNVMALYS